MQDKINLKHRLTILFLFAWLMVSLGVFPLSASAENLLPDTLGPMKLTRSILGEQAKKQIHKLHGKSIEFKNSSIGYYTHGGSQVTLWVSEYKTDEDARKSVQIMAKKIKTGQNPVFRDFKETEVGGLPTYFVTGMGQNHYFYQKNELAVWLAVDAVFSQTVFKAAMDKIQ